MTAHFEKLIRQLVQEHFSKLEQLNAEIGSAAPGTTNHAETMDKLRRLAHFSKLNDEFGSAVPGPTNHDDGRRKQESRGS